MKFVPEFGIITFMERKYQPGVYDKLVRDKIPDKIKADGLRPVTHVASGDEYVKRLRKKLIEEVDKLIAAQTPDQLEEEIGDVIEVLHSFAQLGGRDMRAIETKRQSKHTINGGFAKGIVLEKIEESN